MKNKILILLVLIIGFQTINAQQGRWRTIDLSLNILSPADGHTIFSPDSLKIRFSILNNGPDTILGVDTFSVSYSSGLEGYITPNIRKTMGSSSYTIPFYFFPTKQLLPKDSVVFETSFFVDFFEYRDNINFSVNIGHLNRDPRFRIFAETTSTTVNDNGASVKLKNRHLLNTVETGSASSWQVYPNPSKGHLMLQSPMAMQDKPLVKLFNAKGQEFPISLTTHSNEGVFQCNPEINGNHGVYFLRVQTENELRTFKIILE